NYEQISNQLNSALDSSKILFPESREAKLIDKLAESDTERAVGAHRFFLGHALDRVSSPAAFAGYVDAVLFERGISDKTAEVAAVEEASKQYSSEVEAFKAEASALTRDGKESNAAIAAELAAQQRAFAEFHEARQTEWDKMRKFFEQ